MKKNKALKILSGILAGAVSAGIVAGVSNGFGAQARSTALSLTTGTVQDALVVLDYDGISKDAEQVMTQAYTRLPDDVRMVMRNSAYKITLKETPGRAYVSSKTGTAVRGETNTYTSDYMFDGDTGNVEYSPTVVSYSTVAVDSADPASWEASEEALIHEAAHWIDCVGINRHQEDNEWYQQFYHMPYVLSTASGTDIISSSAQWQDLYARYRDVLARMSDSAAEQVPVNATEGFAAATALCYIHPEKVIEQAPEVYNFCIGVVNAVGNAPAAQ